MTDESAGSEETAVDPNPEEVDSSQPDSEGDHDAGLGPTRSTRTWPNALDLTRSLD